MIVLITFWHVPQRAQVCDWICDLLTAQGNIHHFQDVETRGWQTLHFIN